mmetsp:Transcript_1244/g.2217  ORF Transcript_1244/g.2217 Transcript_1244/m.2217 type:complete len:245 (-) Transcript_1244:180-914(-)|eukprot:CAMPEP_0183756636 /NCGR_PEP_ID=MMETSP0739-20130205/5174_1 /TAXON_ID=385413 /ORGANISM="Thalassiosira miniscula, Strain CCMP1093" /LENGTH=244 /DNA_ID=CAMNT_0025993881 /DNA_START=28 /DNA_END=762 /DNA_ORIENTATION=-
MTLSSIAAVGRGLTRKSAATLSRRHMAPRARLPAGGDGHKLHRKIGPRGVPPISMSVQDMDDRTLLSLAAFEDHAAREEILKRHIMDIDSVPYSQSCETFLKIQNKNSEGYYMVSLPYKIGIGTATFMGMAAIPMVFDLTTVEWFNELAVTTDHPELRDLETPLEVSIWSWNWMEPPLGTMSFILLCMQYVRGQMINLGVKPYTGWIKVYRGEKLANAFPRYDKQILMAYSETATLIDSPQQEE